MDMPNDNIFELIHSFLENDIQKMEEMRQSLDQLIDIKRKEQAYLKELQSAILERGGIK